jgi:LPXTG-motif cell wall-anchored protein
VLADGVTYEPAEGSAKDTYIIPNIPGAALPHTGGPGTDIFTILGSMLILGAAFLLWWRRGTI